MGPETQHRLLSHFSAECIKKSNLHMVPLTLCMLTILTNQHYQLSCGSTSLQPKRLLLKLVCFPLLLCTGSWGQIIHAILSTGIRVFHGKTWCQVEEKQGLFLCKSKPQRSNKPGRGRLRVISDSDVFHQNGSQ